jgi:hypothetical protein
VDRTAAGIRLTLPGRTQVVILRVAKRIFLPIALAFLAYFAWESRDLLVEVVRGARPLTLALSVLVWMLMHALAPLFSTLVFRARNVALSYGTAARIHVTNLPARYIPGGIWHTVGRIAGFRNMDIGQRDISIFVFLENLLAVCVAFVIGGSLLAVSRGLDGWGQIAALSAVGGAIFLLASPFILSFRIIQGDDRFPIRSFVAVTIITAITWCVAIPGAPAPGRAARNRRYLFVLMGRGVHLDICAARHRCFRSRRGRLDAWHRHFNERRGAARGISSCYPGGGCDRICDATLTGTKPGSGYSRLIALTHPCAARYKYIHVQKSRSYNREPG